MRGVKIMVLTETVLCAWKMPNLIIVMHVWKMFNLVVEITEVELKISKKMKTLVLSKDSKGYSICRTMICLSKGTKKLSSRHICSKLQVDIKKTNLTSAMNFKNRKIEIILKLVSFAIELMVKLSVRSQIKITKLKFIYTKTVLKLMHTAIITIIRKSGLILKLCWNICRKMRNITVFDVDKTEQVFHVILVVEIFMVIIVLGCTI